MQYNKRDLTDDYGIDELHRRLGLGDATVFEAVATEGRGLLQTLSTISKKVMRALRDESIATASARCAAPAPRRARAARRRAAPAPDPPRPPTGARAPPLRDAASSRVRRRSRRRALEDAILEETSRPDAPALDAELVVRASRCSRRPGREARRRARRRARARASAATSSIVSVGDATRVDDRSVRLPIVLGDGHGETSTLVLTIRLDALLDEDAGMRKRIGIFGASDEALALIPLLEANPAVEIARVYDADAARLRERLQPPRSRRGGACSSAR